MRSRKSARNVITSLLLQLTTIICGFVVPRAIIGAFGSAVNGTIYSITQFLSYIVLLEAGVGGVVRAALYGPLAAGDKGAVSSIVKATDRFFKSVALIFAAYLALTACFFPFLVSNEFDWLFTFFLVLIIGSGTFAQYYFGLTCQVLLHADQKSYISSALQIVTTLLNTLLVLAFIHFGASIHIVRFGTSFVFILRPLILRGYVGRKYKLDKKAKPDNDAISQRWDGLGHHIAFFLHTNTDIALLTVFSRLTSRIGISEVSVYTVYYSVVIGVEKIVSTLSSGIEAAFGNMIAKGEDEALRRNFGIYEFVSFVATTVLFTCAGLLVLPFVSIYTRNITDADYFRPAFAFVLTLAEAVFCLRIPYNSVTLAAGHFKQTRNGAFAEAFINIALSCALVVPFGITGVAVGTLAAMCFRTVQYALYTSKNIVKRTPVYFCLRLAVNAAASVLSIAAVTLMPPFFGDSYFHWFLYAAAVFAVSGTVVTVLNILFFRGDFSNLLKLIKNTIKRNNGGQHEKKLPFA